MGTKSVVREGRRKTRKKYKAEEKIRIVLEGLRGEKRPGCCGGRSRARSPTSTLPNKFAIGLRASVLCDYLKVSSTSGLETH